MAITDNIQFHNDSPRPLPSFFNQDSVTVAKEILGMKLIRQFEDGAILSQFITETEAYLGEKDLASHASKGRTPRTEVMYREGGRLYVYLIYGLYWLLNVVTGEINQPSAVLIRSLENAKGPGRVGQLLRLDKSFYGEDLNTSQRLWVEEGKRPNQILTSPRIGVAYAGEWALKPWRFMLKD